MDLSKKKEVCMNEEQWLRGSDFGPTRVPEKTDLELPDQDCHCIEELLSGQDYPRLS